jgi:hypothetical protein
VKAQSSCISEEVREQRSQVVFGLSACTRALERGELRLLLTDKSFIHAMQSHLPALCKMRDCVGGLVSGLFDAIGKDLGLTKMSSVGFKVSGFVN